MTSLLIKILNHSNTNSVNKAFSRILIKLLHYLLLQSFLFVMFGVAMSPFTVLTLIKSNKPSGYFTFVLETSPSVCYITISPLFCQFSITIKTFPFTCCNYQTNKSFTVKSFFFFKYCRN